MTLLILFAILAIGVSFLCSLAEAGLLSLPRSHVEALAQQGSNFGLRIKHLKVNIDRSLAAILTLNTVAHTVGAAGVGAQSAVIFGNAAVGIASAVMTLLILVVSEIIPKTLGAVHAKRLAPFTALITQGMIVMCFPLILVLEWFNRLIGYQRQHDFLTRAEILASARLGRDGGLLDGREFRTLTNLLVLAEVKVSDVFTPRTVVFSLPKDMTVNEAIDRHRPIRFARIPIYDADPERMIGYVLRFDIRRAHDAGRGDTSLVDLAKPIFVIPELASVASALDQMLKGRHQIALAVDEYGGMEGIITLEDLLETLLGDEIVDETDPAVDMRELARFRRRPNSNQ